MTRRSTLAALAAAAAAALAAPGCGPFPYDAATGLRITFEGDLAPGAADTLRVWFTTPAGATIGDIQDLALVPPDFEELPFSVNAYAGDVVLPEELTVNAEMRLAENVVASGSTGTALIARRLADVTVLLVPVAPPAPTLVASVTLTNEPTVTVGGVAARGASVRVSGGLSTIDSDPADLLTGDWTAVVPLQANALNTLVAVALGPTGSAGPPSDPVDVVHDDIPPDAPDLGPLPTQTGSSSVIVTGNAEGSAVITIVVTDTAGGATDSITDSALADGTFATAVGLFSDTVNDLAVTATDAAGNVSVAALAAVEHGTGFETPPTVDPTPPYVNTPTVTVTGTATASAMVECTNATNGGMNVVDVADPTTGAFSIVIGLAPNQPNALNVHVVGSMVGVDVVVIHDDIPPDPPVLNGVASPTGAADVDVSGVAEAGATLDLVQTAPAGTTYGAAATGGPSGDFLFSAVPLVIDATSTFAVTQTDRAGNVSVAPATVTVDQVSTIPGAPSVTAPMNGFTTPLAAVDATGTVMNPGPGVEIVVERGGVEVASNTTNTSTGDFTVTVPLAANTTNDLEFFSRLGAAESGRTLLTVTHDDIAPAAPVGALISASGTCPLGAGSVVVSGSDGAVEASALVTVASARETVVVMATSTGSFGASVGVNHPLLASCEGSLSIRATDRAGNLGPATFVSISY